MFGKIRRFFSVKGKNHKQIPTIYSGQDYDLGVIDQGAPSGVLTPLSSEKWDPSNPPKFKLSDKLPDSQA